MTTAPKPKTSPRPKSQAPVKPEEAPVQSTEAPVDAVAQTETPVSAAPTETPVTPETPVPQTTPVQAPVAPPSIYQQVCAKYGTDHRSAPRQLRDLCSNLDAYCNLMSNQNVVNVEVIAEGYKKLQAIYRASTEQTEPAISQMCIDAVAVYFNVRSVDVFNPRLIGRTPATIGRNSHESRMMSSLTRFFTVASIATTRRSIAEQIDLNNLCRYLSTDVSRVNVINYVNS